MSWIAKLFGRKAAPSRPGVTSRVIDVRGDAERATERRAQTPLDAPTEGIAETLTALSLMVEAMHTKSGNEHLLRQLEGYLEHPGGGIGKQELEARIAKERAELHEAEKAIRVLVPWLAGQSISVSKPEDCNHHLSDLGRQLNEKGGQRLMELVAYRCQARGARLVYIQAAWDGIGEWKW